ncbi:hypothetical protein [Rubrivirga sp. IMCC43871]|uniref:hypothetical protein n=1 Tax=Rubrivirga sp. IMCC43871 TaxID=3391575 RepID=UPI00398FE6CC
MARSRFRFPLDPVLRLRERSVDTARETLGTAVATRRTAEAIADRAAQAFDAALAPTDTTTVAAFGGQAAHRDRLRRAEAATAAAAERALADEREARTALASALRQHQAVDALRDAAAETHRADAARAEIAELDDLATLRAR